MKVKGNHPLAEILGKKLLGIENVPRSYQTRMVRAAIKAAVEWANEHSCLDPICKDLSKLKKAFIPDTSTKHLDDIKLVCKYILKEHEALQNLIAGFSKAEPCPCNICEAARRLGGINDENKTHKKI